MTIYPAAVADAAALAVALRARVGVLYDRAPTDDTWEQVTADALAAVTTLAGAVPSLRTVFHWTDIEAQNPEERPELRALAAVRSLEVRLRHARGQRVMSLSRP
ncbi:hypothetical protein [Cellulomonas soli]|uniref:Uncharacterized protein n=1 Tax=Cellulomonas soli TaxID=931535 RepID=A0A512PHK2_9CELL|nr:hypothetical protein [Cellulomonas soli]NYI59170.1 hypothetical protein [Cellulomonas soli]GEP70674.1 hypothetical protein CSO01_33890 [Cellulomonas soli]